MSADVLIGEATDPEQLAMMLDELPIWARSLGVAPEIAAHLKVLIAERYAELALTPAARQDRRLGEHVLRVGTRGEHPTPASGT